MPAATKLGARLAKNCISTSASPGTNDSTGRMPAWAAGGRPTNRSPVRAAAARMREALRKYASL